MPSFFELQRPRSAFPVVGLANRKQKNGMPYTTCKHCKHGYSTGAKTCPKCGKRPTTFVVKVFLGLVIFLVLSMLVGRCKNASTPAEPASERTEAGIHVLGDEILIGNKSAFTWPSVEFTSDDYLTGYSYNYRHPVSPGDFITISQSDFTRGSTRFDPRTTVMTSLYVHVPGHAVPRYDFK